MNEAGREHVMSPIVSFLKRRCIQLELSAHVIPSRIHAERRGTSGVNVDHERHGRGQEVARHDAIADPPSRTRVVLRVHLARMSALADVRVAFPLLVTTRFALTQTSLPDALKHSALLSSPLTSYSHRATRLPHTFAHLVTRCSTGGDLSI